MPIAKSVAGQHTYSIVIARSSHALCTQTFSSRRICLKNVSGLTTSKDHSRRAQFAKEIGQAVRSKHEPDVQTVAQYLQGRGLDKTTAEARAKSKSMAMYVRMKSRPVPEMVGEVRRVVNFHQELDAKCLGQGELPLLTPPK